MWMYLRDYGLPALLLALSLALSALAMAARAQPPSSLDLQAPPKPAGQCLVNDADISFLSDQGLTMKVASRLQFNRELLTEKIDVRVVGAVAILEGRLPTSKLVDTAVRIARETGGIRCVINDLDVLKERGNAATG